MRRWIAVALAALMTGCAGSQKFGDHPEIGGRATGTVGVARDSNLFGSALTAPIQIDRFRVGEVGPGGSISVRVPVGRRLISSTMGDVPFEISAGQTVYFEVMQILGPWMREPDFPLSRINSERWRQLVGDDR